MPYPLPPHAMLIATLCLVFSSATSAEPTALEQAHRVYHQGEFDRSLSLYQRLAADGNAEAAERAGYMLMHGPALFGAQVPRDPARATALLEQAAAAGSAHAVFLLGMTNATD